jgi:hypothetical protein
MGGLLPVTGEQAPHGLGLRGRLARLIAIAVIGISGVCLSHMASADDVFVNERFPIRGEDELSPPIVDPANECASHVLVKFAVPHATVQVLLNGVTSIGGPIVAPFGTIAVPLDASHPQLKTGDRISATQTVNGITSKPTDPPMVVGAMPAALPAPVVDPKIYACGQIVPVRSLISGTTVEVRDFAASSDPNAVNTIIGTGETPNDWGSDWAPVVTSSLIQDHLLRARQTACTGIKSALSANPATVLKEPSLNAPKIDPWVSGNDAVTLRDLLTGAVVNVMQGGGAKGSGLATGDVNWVGVKPPLTGPPPPVTAGQDLCTRGPIATQEATQLASPVLVSPICPDQANVIVRGTTVNATLVLLVGGKTHGYGGAALSDVLLNIAPPARFALNDSVQVAEYIGNTLVFSNQVTVGCHIRRSIATFNPEGPELRSLRRGIEVMMGRNPTDPTSWIYQANLHGTTDSPPQPLWNQCQHASFYFFPWHRMYLYYFERILRAASGDPTLTLPYWNYTDDPSLGDPDRRRLPLPFRQPASAAANPLFVAARAPAINSGTGLLPLSAVDYLKAFTFTNFDGPSGTGAATFGGPTLMHHDTGADSGQLEQTPHNVIHGAIGGWMNDPNMSARDPIFYLHHANIDRLWNLWLRKGGGRQNPMGDMTWMNQPFEFFDENGTKVTLSSKDVLDMFGQLSYCYDDDPTQCH